MVKYEINFNIHGYEKLTVDDDAVSTITDDLVIVVVEKQCDAELGKYYKAVNNLLRNRNRVILISVNDENKLLKPIASLMTTFRAYDIYSIEEKEQISAKYLQTAEEREPDFCEVQSYIGGDVTAYSDMTTLLFGIESLVEEGNQDALKDFLQDHMGSIENLSFTLNNMKKTCDIFNSNELVDIINTMKKDTENLNSKIAEKDKILDEVKHDRDQFKVDADTLKRENTKLRENNEDLQNQVANGGTILKTYNEVNTKLIKCKSKIVLYFKEVSYVQYTNSLVEQLMNFLKNKKLKIKLLIYDTNTELYQTYSPLTIVRGEEYTTQGRNLINRTEKFVVAEPNQSIITDILESDNCFDVVIVYDRIKGVKDLVSGNNVTKFYVINSKKDYDAVTPIIHIIDTSTIITRDGAGIDDAKTISVSNIAGYSNSTDAAKTSKYIKMTDKNHGNLFTYITEKSKINSLYN